MDILIGLLFLAACLGFFWGVFKLFKKGQRRRGFIYVAASFCTLMASASVINLQNERDAKAAGFGSYAEQQEADAAEQERRVADLIAQREQELCEEQEQLDALAREQCYENHATQQEALAVARSAAEAAERADEEARQARLAAKTVGMTEQIASLVRSYYGVEAVPLIPNRPMCREDGYCDFNVGVFRIQVYGAGLADVEPTNQASLTDYVEMCAVAFAAISGSEMSYAVEAVGLIYGAALASGSAERDFSGVEVKFSPALGGAMGCSLFKYWPPIH